MYKGDKMEQKKDIRAFLGTGWKFPITVERASGRIQMSSKEENIEDSIRIIIGTRKGERMMEPEFGCRIWEYSSETVDHTTLYAMKNEVEDSLVQWEPRITEIHVEISDEKIEQGLLLIHISYKVHSKNNVYHLIYPFYNEKK